MRQYDLKGLSLLSAAVSEQVAEVRGLRLKMQDSLKALDTEASKRKYTAEHLADQRVAIRRDALAEIRSVNNSIAERTKSASLERHEWSRGALLSSTDAGISALDKSERTVARIEASMRRMELGQRLSRINDDSLLDFAQHQSRVGDTLALVMSAEESQIRGG